MAFAVALLTVPDNLGPQLAKTQGMTLLQSLKHFDMSGSIFQTAGIALLILGLSIGGNMLPWSHPFVILALVGFVVCSIVLVLVERRARCPIMPLDLLFSSPRGNLIFSHFFISLTMSMYLSDCRQALRTADIVLDTVLFNLPLYVRSADLKGI